MHLPKTTNIKPKRRPEKIPQTPEKKDKTLGEIWKSSPLSRSKTKPKPTVKLKQSFGDLKNRRVSKNIEDAELSTGLAYKGIDTKDLVDKKPKARIKTTEKTKNTNEIVNSYREVIPDLFGLAVAGADLKSKPGKFEFKKGKR